MGDFSTRDGSKLLTRGERHLCTAPPRFVVHPIGKFSCLRVLFASCSSSREMSSYSLTTGREGRGDVNEARRIRRCIALHVEFLTILLALDLALNYSASCRKGLRLSAKLASSCIFCRQRPLALNSITTKGGRRLQQNNLGPKLAGVAKQAEEENYFAGVLLEL